MTEAPSPAISRRAAAVAPFLAMDVMAAAATLERDGRDIVHMEVGQPSAPAPRAAIAAAQAALAGGRVPYTEALGLAPLRERIARHYQDRYGVSVPPERVVVTTGSSAGFVLAFLALFDAGARIAVPQPGYPAYRSLLSALDLVPAPMVLREEDRFAPTAASLRATHAAHGLSGVLVMSPANPSGTLVTPERLAALCAEARALRLPFISDEIYHGLDYAFPAVTAAELSSEAIIINSFSKYFCMTGWRVGWIVVPEGLARSVETLQQNLSISVPTLSQIAAEAAFDGCAEMDVIKHGYEENRRILIEGLPKVGLTEFLPVDGAFYLYADVSKFNADSFEFAKTMLQQAHVAATPGVDFDPFHGKSFVRFSYSRSTQEITEAVARITRWLAKG